MDRVMDDGLRAVVFDFDGLVLDTEWCEYVTAAEVFADHGTELSLDLWKTFIGTTDHPHWTDILEEQIGRPVDRELIVPSRLAAKDVCNADLAPLPGVVPLVDSLRDLGVPIAVASSSSVENELASLKASMGQISSAPAKPAGQIEGNASPAQQAPSQQAAQQPVEPARVSEE